MATSENLIQPLVDALSRSYRGKAQLTSVTMGEQGEGTTRLNYRIPKTPLPMPVYTSGKVLQGDTEVPGALRCLERLASLYGVEVILFLSIVEGPHKRGFPSSRKSSVYCDVTLIPEMAASLDVGTVFGPVYPQLHIFGAMERRKILHDTLNHLPLASLHP